MKKTNGNAIAQYGIIIALVVLALIPVFYLLGKNIVDYFSGFTTTLEKDHSPAVIKTSRDGKYPMTNYKPGDLGGTTDQPVSFCSEGVCAVDYGEFVLNGIPENFQEFAQASGVSGGTDMLSSLIEQIARQLEQQGDIEGATNYRNLANMGYFLSSTQNTIENLLNYCIANFARDLKCLKDRYNSPVNMAVPEEVASLLPGVSSKMTYAQLINLSKEIQTARILKETNPKAYEKKAGTTGYAIIEQLDAILNNPEYSDTMKDVTIALVNQINNIGIGFAEVVAVSGTKPDYTTAKVYDVVTGELLYTKVIGDTGGQLMVHPPEASIGTNIRSTLICNTGRRKNINNTCE
jgi:Flp pilus assembly pilin Flp